MDTTAMTVIVMPVYEDRDACVQLLRELAVLEDAADLYVVAVDDGSMHRPLTVADLESEGIQGELLKLRRNVGHQMAIAIGLRHVSQSLKDGQAVIVMDSDGEDSPQSVSTLLSALGTLAVDVVVAQRRRRDDSLGFKWAYLVYKYVFRWLTGRSMTFGNFMALSPGAVRHLVSMPELPIHLAASVLASKLRVHVCPLDRGRRYAGMSRMNLVALVSHGFRGIAVFAEDVMVRLGIMASGALMTGLLALAGTAVLVVSGGSVSDDVRLILMALLLVPLHIGAIILVALLHTIRGRAGVPVSDDMHQGLIQTVLRPRPHFHRGKKSDQGLPLA